MMDEQPAWDARQSSSPRMLPMGPVILTSVAAALAYPWALTAFHRVYGQPGAAPFSVIFLAIAFALPLSGLLASCRCKGETSASERRIALGALAVPPLFVATGVVSSLVHSPIRDVWTWSLLWIVTGIAAALAPGEPKPALATAAPGRLRVLHGGAASIILLFVTFHLANHLVGLSGPEAHARIMATGRLVYRSPLVEPALIALIFFQVASGLRLAWRRSARAFDLPGVIQVGSGVYLAAFIAAHLNSAFVSARWVHKVPTDWGWATGAPEGLLMDAWNIRLLPHYAFGVFFIVAHLFCGLRAVLLGHRVGRGTADKVLATGLACAGGLSLLIAAALCGLRL